MYVKIKNLFIASCFMPAFISACNGPAAKTGDLTTDSVAVAHAAANYTDTIDGKPVSLFTIENTKGAKATITNYGGRVVSLLVPDKIGVSTDVVLGYGSIKDYQKKGEPFFGALIGRYGNRIAKGKFLIDGKSYQLDINDGVNTLHGGGKGFFARVWDANQVDKQTLELSYISKDGEEGYPGTLTVKVIYKLTDDNTLDIDYTATTDKATIVNLTNHAYFNLNGAGKEDITNHLLTIHADKFTPVDTTLIPTGELKPVKGTPFNFTSAKPIGKDINAADEQLKNGKGYDHNYVLNKHDAKTPVAVVTSPVTGITMEIYTTEPGLQFYSGNFLTGKTNDGKGGVAYGYRSAICLETQHFPDSPNQPAFPSTLLRPGQTYHTNTQYKFLNNH